RRAHFARQLIDDTGLPLAEIAFAAGFGSVRRFNAAMRRAFGRTPTELRARTRRGGERDATLTLTVPVRAPYAWAPLVEFLAARAIPGVESIAGSGDDAVYRRTTSDGGIVTVCAVGGARPALHATLRVPSARSLRDAVERIRRLFDVAADPLTIGETLSRDATLRAAVRACPGRRVPGGWDGLEVAIRAILGQQVSVVRATQLAGKLVAAWGTPLPDPDGAL